MISYFLVCGLSFLLGIGSKENAVTLPIALGLVEVLFFQDLDDRRTRKLCFAGLVATAFIICVGGVMFFLNGNISSLLKGSSFRYFSPLERVMTEPRVLVFYLSQIFYPVISRYSIEHDIAVSTSLLTPATTLPAILLITALIGLGFSQMRKRPILSFAILFFFLNHLIESSFISLELIFEHRNYLPSLFLFLPAAVAVKWLADHYHQRNKFLGFTLAAFVAILIMLLGSATYTRNMVWATEYSLWKDAAAKAPGSNRPLHNLAWSYYERIGDYDSALHLYKTALRLKMNNTAQKSLILNNMASIYFRRSDFPKAAELWQAAVDAYPQYAATKYRLALALEKSGQTQNALDILNEILSRKPDYTDPLILKGTILLKQKQFDRALASFRKCLYRRPFDKQAIVNIGITYYLMDQYERADLFFKINHRRHPADWPGLVWLIETSFKSGNKPAMDRYTDKFLQLIRIEELKSIRKKLDPEGLMDPLAQEHVFRQISQRIVEHIENLSRHSL